MNKSTGQLVQLSDYRKPKAEDEQGYITIYLPEDYLPSDEFEALTITDSVREWKVRCGDIAIVYITDDVQKGDVVGIQGMRDGKEICVIGTLDLDECYYYAIETRGLDEVRFHRAYSQLIGRVVEIQRAGKVIQTTLPLRPIREVAKVYQFALRQVTGGDRQ